MNLFLDKMSGQSIEKKFNGVMNTDRAGPHARAASATAQSLKF
jgi:hypothetical protein